jgi:cytochrome c biogenesis protein
MKDASMTPLTHANSLRAEIDADGLEGTVALSPSDVLDRLWRVFTSMRTALVLMLALAALALVGAILIQAPAGLSSDPQAYAAWLERLRPKYGGWVPILDRLGLLSVFQTIWFKAILVGLTTSILACSVNRYRGLWKTAVRPRTRMAGSFYDRAPQRATIDAGDDLESTADATRSIFRARHFRTVVEADGDVVHLYADRFRWAPFGTLIAHISLVLILVGALVGSAFGFRNGEFAATVGTTVDVGGGTGLALLARSFSDSYYENGAPSDYASDVVLYREGVEVASQTIRVNEPLSYDGVSFYQSFFGPAAVMRVADAKGNELYDQGVPLLWSSDDGTRRVGQFALPGAGLTAFVVGAASGQVDPTIKAGQMQLEIYEPGSEQPFAIEIVSQGKPTTIRDLQFTFQREQEFTGLIVARDPGVTFVWLGAFALVGGLFIVFLFPNRRIWAAVRRLPTGGSEVRLGATARHDATFGPEFQDLVHDMRLALEPGAHEGKGHTVVQDV